ncbi:MAG: sugar-binding transcriptional regulator [Pseudomonadota bacterium]
MLDKIPSDEAVGGTPALPGDDPQQALRVRAAWIYYVEGRTQNEVAQILGLSRVAVTRLLADAKRRREVSISVTADLAELVALERTLEARYTLKRAIVAPFCAGGDPTRVVAAAAGAHVSALLGSAATVGVGWGRTLYEMLAYLEPRPLPDMQVISFLGGISEAKRFNPAEFAWRFAELFDAEGFLVPAPAIVDSRETRHALVEHCGLDQIFQRAEACDMALLSCAGISSLTTSYRIGHVSEAERLALIEAGAVGDILYNFIDRDGDVVRHPVNERAMSVSLKRLRRIKDRILISGGPEKVDIMRATLKSVEPTTLITDEQTAKALAAGECVTL